MKSFKKRFTGYVESMATTVVPENYGAADVRRIGRYAVSANMGLVPIDMVTFTISTDLDYVDHEIGLEYKGELDKSILCTQFSGRDYEVQVAFCGHSDGADAVDDAEAYAEHVLKYLAGLRSGDLVPVEPNFSRT